MLSSDPSPRDDSARTSDASSASDSPSDASSPSDGPSKSTRLDADLPEPFGGAPLPSSRPDTNDAETSQSTEAEASDTPADVPESEFTDDERDAMELSDDDLDMVAGGLPRTRLPSPEDARRLFVHRPHPSE